MVTPALLSLPSPAEVLQWLHGLFASGPSLIQQGTGVGARLIETSSKTLFSAAPLWTGTAKNTGTGDLEVKGRLTAYSGSTKLRSVEGASFVLRVGESLPLVIGPVDVLANDPPGEVKIVSELVRTSDGTALASDQVILGTLVDNPMLGVEATGFVPVKT